MNAALEITRKSQAQINKETARTWAARAIAYCRSAKQAVPGTERSVELWRGYDDARHEALEHAALAGDRGKTVGRIERLLDATRAKKASRLPRSRRR